MEIYIAKNKQQMGPYDIGQVTQMLQSGILAKHDLYWHEGMLDWAPVAALNLPLTSPPLVPEPMPTSVKKTLPTAFDDSPSMVRNEVKTVEKVLQQETSLRTNQKARSEKSPLPTQENKSRQGDSEISIKHIIRDIVIVVGISFVGCFFLGLLSSQMSASEKTTNLAIGNFILVTIGFFICALLHKGSPWRHLRIVAIGSWAFGIINLFVGGTLHDLFIGLPAVFICMGLGGGLAVLFKKAN